MSTQNVSDFVHPIRFVERRKLLQTAAAVAAAGVLPVVAASAPKKITVVTGSPHRRGASFLLTDEFIRGAKEVGAEIIDSMPPSSASQPAAGATIAVWARRRASIVMTCSN